MGRSDAPRKGVGSSDPTLPRCDVRIRCEAEVATWLYAPLRDHFPQMSACGAGRVPRAYARLGVGWSRQLCAGSAILPVGVIRNGDGTPACLTPALPLHSSGLRTPSCPTAQGCWQQVS